MATYWDFRRVLNVDPDYDHTCVGRTLKSKKCKNIVGVNYRREACRILNRMDTTKSHSSALTNLEDLAGEMLCKLQHNRENKPHLNQVNEVSTKWHAVAVAEYKRASQEADRAAKQRARRELSHLREAAQHAKDELETDNADKVIIQPSSVDKSSTHGQSSDKTPIEDDLVVVATTSATVSMKLSQSPTATTATSVDWPVVPRHKPSSRIAVFSDPQPEENQVSGLLAERPLSTACVKEASLVGYPRSDPSFSFAALSNENTTLDLAFENKSGPSISHAMVSESRKQSALKQKAISTHNSMLHKDNLPSTSVSAFAETIPSSAFTFEAPKLLPELDISSSSHISPAESPAIIEENTPENTVAEEGAIIRLNTDIQDGIQERPFTPISKQAESFGYAVVTPPSTRHKTYLPARQQHGLMTPPETPENFSQARRTSTPHDWDVNYFANSLIPDSPTPKIKRRPLPAVTAPVVMESQDPEYQAPVDLRASQDGQHEEVRSSCLSRFGLSRLRERVATKLKSAKPRLSSSKQTKVRLLLKSVKMERAGS